MLTKYIFTGKFGHTTCKSKLDKLCFCVVFVFLGWGACTVLKGSLLQKLFFKTRFSSNLLICKLYKVYWCFFHHIKIENGNGESSPLEGATEKIMSWGLPMIIMLNVSCATFMLHSRQTGGGNIF